MNKLYNDTAVQAIANAIRAKNGSSDTYTIAEMSTALNDLSYYAKPTISNVPLATFEADGLPLNSLKVSVEAKQDLHGYDKPWVGGDGKNKCPYFTSATVDNVVYTVGNDGIITANGTSSGGASIFVSVSLSSGTYILSGAPQGSGQSRMDMLAMHDSTVLARDYDNSTQRQFTLSETTTVTIYIRAGAAGIQFNNTQIKPMIRLTGTSDDYEPYSNICPISGWDNVVVSDVDDVDNPTVTQTTTIPLGQTVYGAEVDVVNGILKITDGYIASYNGETLPSTWISSMDEYAEGTSPTTGAEVCYELANPISTNLTPSLIKSLNGLNNLSVDCGEVIELEYFKEV